MKTDLETFKSNEASRINLTNLHESHYRKSNIYDFSQRNKLYKVIQLGFAQAGTSIAQSLPDDERNNKEDMVFERARELFMDGTTGGAPGDDDG